MSTDIRPESPRDWRDRMHFDANGLVPVVVQDIETRRVLMLAWASAEALALSVVTGQATYWSRSRGELWVKGATSGHKQRLCQVAWDCDADAVLYLVEQTGPACHTGAMSCFDVSGESVIWPYEPGEGATTIGWYGAPPPPSGAARHASDRWTPAQERRP